MGVESSDGRPKPNNVEASNRDEDGLGVYPTPPMTSQPTSSAKTGKRASFTINGMVEMTIVVFRIEERKGDGR